MWKRSKWRKSFNSNSMPMEEEQHRLDNQEK